MLRFAALHAGVDSPFAWLRLVAAVVLSTIGSVGMWSVPVVLPAVQAEFGVARADASLPFTLAMIGFACGGVAMGRLTDRFGIGMPVICGALALAAGYVAAGFSHSLMLFALVHTLIGLGASATFGPLIAESSQWFTRRRGIAVAIVSSGNYFGGTIWPPVVQHFVATEGWRATHIGIGAFCALTMLPFLLALRRRPPMVGGDVAGAFIAGAPRGLGLSPNALQAVLCLAGLSCCVAMSMPQVHIVRQYFSPQEAGTRLGIVLMATVFGMALGGWMSGVIFDLTGSYQAAFVNGLIWNLVNVSIALWLLTRPAGGPRTDEPRLLFARHGANGRG